MMGNRLAYKPEYQHDQLQQDYNIKHFSIPNHSQFDLEQSQRRPLVDDLEVETVMLDDSGNASHVSAGGKQRYIVRYRSEEERLADQLLQTQTKLHMAIEQGQKLRAKTNRYEDELKTLKIQQNQADTTDSHWKKKYYDVDKQYRNLKEDFDVLVARNKNGRDFLRQRQEDMTLLLNELQKERLAKDELLHGSLSSLSKLSESGTKNKKAKQFIQQLEIDKRLLEERLRDLSVRNQRGREYLGKLELEKRQQENIIAELETDLHNVKSERNEFMNKLGMSSRLWLHENQEYIEFSDETHPSNMAERYQQLYENEWMDAFTEQTVAHGIEEQQAIQMLLNILTIVFQHCQKLASSQLENVEKIIRDFNTTAESLEGKEFISYLKAQRRMKYSYNVESIKMTLDSQLQTFLPAVEPKFATKSYITAVIDFCWLVNLQDPPCTISWDLRTGEPFQTDKYRVYKHSGKQVDYIVWPVMYSHQGGVVLLKGVAQAIHCEHFNENDDETIIVTTVMPLNPGSADVRPIASNGLRHFESPKVAKRHNTDIEIDTSAIDKGMIPAAGAAPTTFHDPMHIEDVEVKASAYKHPPSSNDHTYEPVAVSSLPDTQKQIEVKTMEEIVQPLDEMYAVVKKPRKDDFNTRRHLTDVEYEEMEYVADEECITRF